MDSIKVPRNIIIESSNSVSKNTEGFNVNNQLNIDENIRESKNNARWNTRISNPIKLEVGDEVNILTASINQIGTSDQSIEFLGNINNSLLVDNAVRFDMNYYITNELKFNLPLPLSTTIFTKNNSILSTYQYDYLNIDISTLENFQKAFPYQNLENLKFIPGKLYHTGNERMYLCKKDWAGLYKNDYTLTTEPGFDDITVTSKAELHTNQIDVNLPIGLETPSNISSKITYIFHQKLDTSDKSKYINPITTQITETTSTENFYVEDKDLFQEKSYFAIANPPSRGIYAQRERGLLNDIFFKVEPPYDVNKYNKIFWENCLMKDVNHINAVVNFNKIRQSNSFSNNTISTASNPQYYTFINDVIRFSDGSLENTINNGTIGKNIVVADYLNLKNELEKFNYYYDLQIEEQGLNLQPGDVIMTNLLNTPENIQLLNDSFKLNEFPIEDSNYPSSIPNFENQLFKDTLVTDLQFGSIDESVMNINSKFNEQLDAHGRNLPFTTYYKSNPHYHPNLPTVNTNIQSIRPGNYLANNIKSDIYPNDYDNRYLITDDYLQQQSFDSLSNPNTGKNKKFGYNVRVHTRYNKDRIKNLPTSTLFTLDNVNDKQFSYELLLGDTYATSSMNNIPLTSSPINIMSSNFIRISPTTLLTKIIIQIHLTDGTVENVNMISDYRVTRTPAKNNGLINNYVFNFYIPLEDKYNNSTLKIRTENAGSDEMNFTIRTPTLTYFNQNYNTANSNDASNHKFRYENTKIDLTTITTSNIQYLQLNLQRYKKYIIYMSSDFTFDNDLYSDPNIPQIITDSRDNNYLGSNFGGTDSQMFLRIIDYPSLFYIRIVDSNTTTYWIQVNLESYVYQLESSEIKNKSFLGFVVKDTYDISIPRPSIFEHFGLSKSLCDNELAFPITVQKQEILDNGIITYYDTDTHQGIYETNLMIGSNLLNLDFNNINSKMEFKNFHQPSTSGQGTSYSTFNQATEISDASDIPPLATQPELQIQKIYQKENIFSYIFHKLYDNTSLSVSNSVAFASDDVTEFGFIYDNITPIKISNVDMYPAFVSGSLSGASKNYDIPYTNAAGNDFFYKIKIEGSNDNNHYEQLLIYVSQTPFTQFPITNISTALKVPNCVDDVITNNLHALQRINVNNKKPYRYFKFSVPSDGQGNSLEEPLNIFGGQAFCNISKVSIYTANLGDGKITSSDIISSQSGSAISSLSVPKTDNSFYKINNKNPLSYEKTLLDKLGFNLLTLLPLYGQPSLTYDRFLQNEYSSYNSKSYLMYLNQVKPVSTNAKLDGSVIQAFVKNAYQYPMFNLGTPSYDRQAQTIAESDTITAKNLAEKYSYPYLTIYSNIISNHNDYYGGNEVSPLNIFGIVNRSYSASDYTFLQDNQISYIVEREQIINNFDVKIRLPNGKEIELNTESSVIFRINKTKDLYISQMKYSCQDCEFQTNDKTKYEKHIKTKKHLNKIKE